MEITRTLARFVVSHDYAALPADVRHEATRSLVNWVGCALGGASHEAVDGALAALADYGRLSQATVLGRSERLDTLHAALVNGLSSHVLDFDDTHLRTLLHASAPVAPVLLALSETRRISGAELIHAFVLGVETESRVANAIYANHNTDWYITGTAGPFGAAAAAAKVLGLNEQQTTWALGIAATEGAGLRQMAGTMSKALVHGRAAQNGLYAALLARKGFTASELGLEGPRGFLKVFGGDAETITQGLGERYEVSLNTYKPYACGVVAHPVIDACIELRAQHALRADAIDRVSLVVHPQALKLTGIRSPSFALEAKWSIYHSAAVAIARGAASEHEYSDACVFDPAMAALRSRIDAREDPGLAQDEARVTIVLTDGRTLEHHVEHATGSIERPMTDDQLSEKFNGLAESVLPQHQIEELLDVCWSVESLDDSAELARQAVPRMT